MLWKQYRRPLPGWGSVPGPSKGHRGPHEGWHLSLSYRTRQKLLCTLCIALSSRPFPDLPLDNLPALSLCLSRVSYEKLWHETAYHGSRPGFGWVLFRVVNKVEIDQSTAVRPKRTCSTESNFFLTLTNTLALWPTPSSRGDDLHCKKVKFSPRYTQLDRY